MKRLTLFVISITFMSVCFGQSTAGITHVKDTSYSMYSAFLSTQKSHPNIKMVNAGPIIGVEEKLAVPFSVPDKKNNEALLIDAFYSNQSNSTKNSPAIIIIHGGGWRTGDRSQHHPLARQLAGRGYVCFTPQYRLSTHALFPAAVNDIKDAIKWVKENASTFKVDTNRIAILGFSAGGELAAFVGATNGIRKFDGTKAASTVSSVVQAVIDIDGILAFIHPESGEGDDSKRISAATHWFGYSKTENPELWKEGSPLTHVGKHAPPILFLNSSVARMHAGREDYIRELSKYNIYSEVHEFENSPHSFCLFHPWFEQTVDYVDDFLKKIFR